MRKDIKIQINTGDIVLHSSTKRSKATFSWTTNPSGLVRYIYGEIEIPSAFSEKSIKENGIYLDIPYTPIYQEFYIRIKRISENETFSYMQNEVNGSEWFLVKAGIYGDELANVYASELILISNDRYYLKLNGEFAEIYSGYSTDMEIAKVDRQNANLLLKCLPGSNYRYPLSGVGLVRWVNGNPDGYDLAERLVSEFTEDGMSVSNASFDFETLDLKFELMNVSND